MTTSSVPEPAFARTRRGVTEGRWRWWYSAIADYRIQHPGCSNEDVAKHLNKAPNTIWAITKSDLYREYEAQRREQWRRQNEEALRNKLLGVTTKALNILDEQLEKKKDQVPIGMVKEIVETGLDRLGFAPANPVPSINIVNQQVSLPNSVTPVQLEEARMALRAVEAQKLFGPAVVLEAEPAGESPPESEEMPSNDS
jgi:hypothetical protein